MRLNSKQGSRSTRQLLGAALVALTLGLAALTGAAAVVGQSSTRPIYQPPQRYYLALGDSIAYGFQPTKANAPPSKVTTGYVDLFAARLRRLAREIRVVNYGCPGESTVTFVRGGCDWLKHGGKLHDPFRGPQLRAAQAFLR